MIQQWQRLGDSDSYLAVGETFGELPPGIYDVVPIPNVGLVWSPIAARDDLLLKFPDSASGKVVDEIALFWQQEERFRAHGVPFKRGILLYGPPGSGKSATLRIVAEDVVTAGGYVIQFTKPGGLVDAVRQLRVIHPSARVVVLMEDLDTILSKGDESKILQLLDGAENVDRMVFLATTNYPELLKPRISNRPSRFDRRVLIGFPTSAARRMYLEAIGCSDVEKFVKDTQDMSLAHVKELFVATEILEADYDTTLEELRGMGSAASSVEGTGYQPGGYA